MRMRQSQRRFDTLRRSNEAYMFLVIQSLGADAGPRLPEADRVVVAARDEDDRQRFLLRARRGCFRRMRGRRDRYAHRRRPTRRSRSRWHCRRVQSPFQSVAKSGSKSSLHFSTHFLLPPRISTRRIRATMDEEFESVLFLTRECYLYRVRCEFTHFRSQTDDECVDSTSNRRGRL